MTTNADNNSSNGHTTVGEQFHDIITQVRDMRAK